MHGGDRKSTDAKSSSLNANLIDSSKTCDRIAEENGVSRASVLRASHYTRGIDIADNRSPGIKQKVLRFAMRRPALYLNEPEACWNSEEGQRSLVGARPLHLLLQDHSVAQKPHWGFHCCAAQTRACLGRRNRLIIPPAKKPERSRRGTPCCTYCYRMWILAGCVLCRGAPCFCFYGNSCCSICNERVISADSQCSGLIQDLPCKSCTDLEVLRPIGAFPPAQQFIF